MEISLDGRELALSPAMKGHGGREVGGEKLIAMLASRSPELC